MVGHLFARNASGPMTPDYENSPRLGYPSQSSKMLASTSELPIFITENQSRRTVSLRLFIWALVCFTAVALALGLGLGLGCARYRALYTTPFPPLSNYTIRYGIPENLDFVPTERLINKRELELDTNFIVSSEPRVREFEFNVSVALAAPDGFRKPMVLVNGQSPGPLIEANVGDMIRVRVNNHMTNSSTSIHWHGMNQIGTPWMDGVAGVSQCGIPAGQGFMYEFRVVDQRGTFWWHAHSSVQYSDGAYGAIVRSRSPCGCGRCLTEI